MAKKLNPWDQAYINHAKQAGLDVTLQRTPNHVNTIDAHTGEILSRRDRGMSLGETLVKRALPALAIGGGAMLAAPAVLGAAGVGGGAAAGAGGVAGALSKIPMIGGALSKGYGMLGGADGLLSLGAGIEGYEQDRQANRLRGNALDRLGQEYSANAPLREMGRTGMLNEQAPDLSSTFKSQGNPYAASASPMPPSSLATPPVGASPLGMSPLGIKPLSAPSSLNPSVPRSKAPIRRAV